MPQLTVKNLKKNDERIFNLPQDNITIGRIGTCDVELQDKSISRKHAEIVREGDDYFLIDLKSGNGTILNGKKIRPIEKHLLRPNDVIKIEDFEIHFSTLEEALNEAVEEDTDTDIIEVKMIKKVLGALNKDIAPSLEILNGPAQGKKIFFTQDLQEVDIGRDPKSTFPIDDPVISRNHSKLVRKWGGIVLLDLNSRNGCFVNNEKIHEKLLRDGDKVMLGTVKLLYRNPQDINIEAIGQEISRKKQEAALKESELMEIKKKKQEELQEAERLEQEEAERQAEEEAQKLEEPEVKPTLEPIAPPPPTAQETQNQLSAKRPFELFQAGKQGLSLFEKVLIGGGALILLLALIAVIWILI